MSEPEVAFMGGKDHLEEVEAPHRRRIPLLPRVNGVYRMPEDCVHLTRSPGGGAPVCDSHEAPDRPRACGAFEAGSFLCRQLRTAAGIDTPRDFQVYLAVTSQDGTPFPDTMPKNPPAAPPMAA